MTRLVRLERVGAAVLAAVLVVMSGGYLLRDLQMASAIRSAERLEAGAAFSPEAVSRLTSHEGVRSAAIDCRGANAATQLHFAALDVLPADADPDLRAGLLDATRDTLTFALACSPLDSTSWLYYGRVGLERDEAADDAIEALRLSSMTAPAEAAVLFRRLSYLQWLDATGVSGIEDLFAADLRVAMLHLAPPDLASLYESAAPSTRANYRDLLDLLEPARRERVEGHFDQIDEAGK